VGSGQPGEAPQGEWDRPDGTYDDPPDPGRKAVHGTSPPGAGYPHRPPLAVHRLSLSSTLRDPASIDGDGTTCRRVPHNRQENQ